MCCQVLGQTLTYFVGSATYQSHVSLPLHNHFINRQHSLPIPCSCIGKQGLFKKEITEFRIGITCLRKYKDLSTTYLILILQLLAGGGEPLHIRFTRKKSNMGIFLLRSVKWNPFHHLQPFLLIPDTYRNIMSEFGFDQSGECGFQCSCIHDTGIENHIPTLQIRNHILPTDLFTGFSQCGHRNHPVSTDIDSTEKSDVDGHLLSYEL